MITSFQEKFYCLFCDAYQQKHQKGRKEWTREKLSTCSYLQYDVLKSHETIGKDNRHQEGKIIFASNAANNSPPGEKQGGLIKMWQDVDGKKKSILSGKFVLLHFLVTEVPLTYILVSFFYLHHCRMWISTAILANLKSISQGSLRIG